MEDFRGWKVERTMNKKHLVFIELNKMPYIFDSKLKDISIYIISFYHLISLRIRQSSVITPLLRI